MVSFRPLAPWQDPRGGQIERVTIDNGIIALEVLSLGGIIRSLWTPNREGERGNVVLGCDSAEDYLAQDAHLGAIAGRYANRVANGQMSFNNEHYQLDVNQATNCLHGGSEGFNRKHWHIGQLPDGVRLSLVSPDGDMGFPGKCNIQLDYRLTGNNLYMEIFAATNKPCPISLTQHSYFNLESNQSISNRDHFLQIKSQMYLPLNELGLPTKVSSVKGTNLDFRQIKAFANAQDDPAFSTTCGIDHCYLTGAKSTELTHFGSLSAPHSGRSMILYTNQPSVQIYGANFLGGEKGRYGQLLNKHQAVCMEPQQIPNGPNQTELICNPWILPNQVYHHISRYQFETF
ncbi:galactose mutarotase [Shewanella sp. VB17]|uniref:aldose epimerase family protein n=1 Tax=Shewanella sp. VB17 TaxID=2739432 RepID=UPI001563B6F1|nr:aldose epimerase family protein [Shewanella sp. VB17]NRD72421.1 galactose mutarotase [Shewanella sp. VB17]